MATQITHLKGQMQDERMARAKVALQNGEMMVLPLDGYVWTIASKGSRYTVSLDGDAWACTCPDFTGRCQRFGLRCKHIEAVRIVEAGQVGSLHTKSEISVPYTEENMTQPSPTTMPVQEMSGQDHPSAPPGQKPFLTEEVIWRLRQPLDMSRVKRRQASGQGTVPYLEGYDVIEVANDLFHFHWSFDLLGEPRIMRWHKVVTFYDQRLKKKVPVLSEDGKPTTEVAGVAYITGRITLELGHKNYSHADVGRCIFSGDTPEALDMAIAGAATDCLKRCFRQLGEQFGNSLYDKEIAKTAGLENGASSGSTPHRSQSQGRRSGQALKQSPPTPSDSSTSHSVTLQYRDGVAVDPNNAVEVNAFNDFRTAHQDLAPTSREVLRAWVSSLNPNSNK